MSIPGSSKSMPPVLENLVLNASGRYDDYSSGQSNFSPKVGVWYKPIDMVTLKGTYSEGFRIPSFAEANALPTTGYVSNNVSLFNDAFLAQYGCSVATYNSCDGYIHGSYGQTTLASPNLQPEKSRSWVFERDRQSARRADADDDLLQHHQIGRDHNAQQLAGPAGLLHWPTDPGRLHRDPRMHPILRTRTPPPTVAFVQSQLINANTIKTSGFDFGATYDTDLDFLTDLMGLVHLTSSANATFIQSLDTEFPDGHVEHYAGTLGNFNLTAGSGTPSWRAIWQNTFTSGIFDVTGTVNFFSGYNLSAEDQGTGYRDCGFEGGTAAANGGTYYGNQACRVGDAITFDMNLQARVTDQATVYFTVLNVFDDLPPVDNITYGAINYNPVQAGDMILGRYLKVGVKVAY